MRIPDLGLVKNNKNISYIFNSSSLLQHIIAKAKVLTLDPDTPIHLHSQ